MSHTRSEMFNFVECFEFVSNYGRIKEEKNEEKRITPGSSSKFPDLTVQKPKTNGIQTVTPYEEAKAHIKEILDRLKQNKTESPKDIFDERVS